MNKQKLEQNIVEIIKLYNDLQISLSDLLKGIKEEGNQRNILDEFLDFLYLEKNDESRYAAYSRIVGLHENALELYLKKNNFSKIEIDEKLDLSYKFVCDFHSEIQSVIISVIEKKNLLTPFYLEIFKGVANVGLAFNDFFLPWRNHIIRGINRDLEQKFNNNSNKIIDFLNENNLFDKGHRAEQADRSYSALVYENGNYISKSYFGVFENEVNGIVEEIDIFIGKISILEDEIYNSKQNYIDYLSAIKNAFLEINTDLLVEKWSKVDEAWMNIKTPFQIGHPLEFYEDKYRKAVAPEWDLRILNRVFESDVEESITSMYELFYDEIPHPNPLPKGEGIEQFDARKYFKSSYEFSLANQKRVQLYLSSPVLYYSSELTGLFSAQVVPNDEVISKAFGKKIFAFPEMVLANKRNAPFMRLDSIIFDENLLNQYRKILFSQDKVFYKIYDIETIGHEFGHTLWLDLDTEVLMNKKSGVYKNIEEFKATTGGLVMYFFNENLAPTLQKELVIFHLIRCIGLLKYMKVNEIEPYYSESLIHLDIMFESGIFEIIPHPNPLLIGEGIEKKYQIKLNFTEETYEKLKENYINHYKKLINIYLNKIDALEFLRDYTLKIDGNYLPKNEKLRYFVEYYYNKYNDIGNEIDNISKDFYKN